MQIGKLIVIEGTDGSGKATQTDLRLKRLNKEKVTCKLIDFPRYQTPTGRIVGQSYLGKKNNSWGGDSGWFGEADLLDPKIASLYYAADRRATKKEIEETLNAGFNLILDRYYQSNMAHQGGKLRDLKKREDIFKWLQELELNLLKIPKEDLVIFLHMPVEVTSELKPRTGEKLDKHESNKEHLKNAEETYLQLAELYNWTTIKCAPDGTINSLKTPEEIHQEIYQIVEKELFNNSKKQLQIYFSGAIRGGRQNVKIYSELIAYLKKYGEVLTEHIGISAISEKGEEICEEEIHNRDMKLLEKCGLIVADVTIPSLGVGYEIRRGIELGRKILCIYNKLECQNISAMIKGSERLTLKGYENIEEAKRIIDEFIVQGI